MNPTNPTKCLTPTMMETASGYILDLAHPDTAAICIEDIATALANQCRFNGHCARPYSVAEHSIRVAIALKPRGPWAQLYGLLHDAHEAYTGDIVRPLIVLLPGLGDIQARIQSAIYASLSLPEPSSTTRNAIQAADDAMLAIEARDLMPSQGLTWGMPDPDPAIPFDAGEPTSDKGRFIDFYQGLRIRIHRPRIEPGPFRCATGTKSGQKADKNRTKTGPQDRT